MNLTQLYATCAAELAQAASSDTALTTHTAQQICTKCTVSPGLLQQGFLPIKEAVKRRKSGSSSAPVAPVAPAAPAAPAPPAPPAPASTTPATRGRGQHGNPMVIASTSEAPLPPKKEREKRKASHRAHVPDDSDPATESDTEEAYVPKDEADAHSRPSDSEEESKPPKKSKCSGPKITSSTRPSSPLPAIIAPARTDSPKYLFNMSDQSLYDPLSASSTTRGVFDASSSDYADSVGEPARSARPVPTIAYRPAVPHHGPSVGAGFMEVEDLKWYEKVCEAFPYIYAGAVHYDEMKWFLAITIPPLYMLKYERPRGGRMALRLERQQLTVPLIQLSNQLDAGKSEEEIVCLYPRASVATLQPCSYIRVPPRTNIQLRPSIVKLEARESDCFFMIVFPLLPLKTEYGETDFF